MRSTSSAVFGSSSNAAPDGQDLTGEEMRALFSGKTVSGRHVVKNYDFESYYEPHGKVRVYVGAERKLRNATWTIQGSEICLNWKDTGTLRCRKMVKGSDGKYRKEKELSGGRRQVVVTFSSFVDGNPNKL